MKKYLTIANFFRLISVISLFISIKLFSNSNNNFDIPIFIFCVFFVQQITFNLPVEKRISDLVNVIRIYILMVSVHIVINNPVTEGNWHIFIIAVIINFLLLIIGKYQCL